MNTTDLTTRTETTRTDATPATAAPARRVAPPVDILESQTEWRVVADLPGVAKDDVELDVDNDRLTLRATRHPVDGGTLVAGRDRATTYERSFVVPKTVDRDAVRAELRDGVLTLTLPKSASVLPRRISVQ